MENSSSIIKLVKESRKDNLINVSGDIYAGIDEVGVSSIAGCLVCSVVVLPQEHGINRLPIDSKLLQDSSIISLTKEIEDKAIYYAIFAISPTDVDEEVQKGDMLSLHKKIWLKAIESVRDVFPNIRVILDGKNSIKDIQNLSAYVGADNKYDAVSASAIISKNWCDDDIRKASKSYPQYLLSKHKGYPTNEHLDKIREYGLTPFHRVKMAEKALQKPKETKVYSMDELEKALRKSGEFLSKDTSLTNEKTLPFFKQMWVKVIKEKSLPTEKQQRYLMSICKAIQKNGKKKYS